MTATPNRACPRDYRLIVFVLALLTIGAALSVPLAAADAALVVTTAGVTGGDIVLVAENGSRQTAEDRSASGFIHLIPRAGAGSYEVTITARGVSETATVDIPRIGTVSIVFDPAATAGGRITIETVTRVESITVTGLRRDQQLQDVSAGITAITIEKIEATGADDFVDYARTIPGLNFADLGPNRAEINIRGMGKLTAGSATVGVYIDDVAVTDSFNNPDLKLFDVERIEVLRGPQGTLYGEASMGGAIRILTAPANPSGSEFKFDGTGSSTSGGGNSFLANVMANFPVPRDKFALRLVAYTRDEDGWVDNPILNLTDLNHADTEGGRLGLRWFPTDESILSITGSAQNVDVGGQPFTTEGLGDLEQFTSIPESDEEDLTQGILNFNHNFGWAELAWITGVIERDYVRVIDFGFPVDFTSDQKILSQEVRLASATGNTDWVTGLYYKKWDQDNSLVAVDLFGPGVDFGNFIEFNTENFSLFGEVTKVFSTRWSGTLGARIFDEDKRDPFTQTIGGVPFDETDLESSSSGVLPKLGLSFEASDNVKLYLVGAEGYRSGGVNPIVSMNPNAPPTYDEDTNRSLELGLKTSGLGQRLTFNAALFRVDWEDMQISGTPENSALGFTTNAGDAHTQGIEVELTARPNARLGFEVSGALLEAELDDPAEGGAAGNRLPHTVEEQFSLGADYTFTLGSALSAVVRGDIQHRGDAFSDVLNGETDRTAPYTLGNLRFTVEGNRWAVIAFWHNVGDERAELVRFNGGLSVYRNQPETIGLTFRVNR